MHIPLESGSGAGNGKPPAERGSFSLGHAEQRAPRADGSGMVHVRLGHFRSPTVQGSGLGVSRAGRSEGGVIPSRQTSAQAITSAILGSMSEDSGEMGVGKGIAGERIRAVAKRLVTSIPRRRIERPSEQRSDSLFNRELEDGTRMHDLMTPEGKSALKEAIHASQGRAFVVVHPFFDYHFRRPELKDEKSGRIDAYAQRLTQEVQEHRDKGDVIILFEEEYKKDDIGDILTQLGAAGNSSAVFVVPTQNQEYGRGSSPEPHNGTPLRELANELHTLGLTNATVAGTQFYEATWKAADAEGDRYGGCAGYTLERLKEAGITTSVADAVLD